MNSDTVYKCEYIVIPPNVWTDKSFLKRSWTTKKTRCKVSKIRFVELLSCSRWRGRGACPMPYFATYWIHPPLLVLHHDFEHVPHHPDVEHVCVQTSPAGRCRYLLRVVRSRPRPALTHFMSTKSTKCFTAPAARWRWWCCLILIFTNVRVAAAIAPPGGAVV